MRYTLTINFNEMWNGLKKVTPNPIVEKIKALKECEQYYDCHDETVKTAYIIDNVTGKTIKTIK